MSASRVLKAVSKNFLNLSEHGLVYGPQGRMLLRNLEEHWFLHCVTMSPYNIFLSEKFVDTLNFLMNSPMGKIPFGVAGVSDSKDSWNESVQSLKLERHREARIAVFDRCTEAKSLYHKMQKERKVWWRRLAQQPSRFQIKAKETEDLDSVDVEAEFSFGTVTVEKIIRRKLSLEINDKKDLADIQTVEHVLSFDWGCLALLCDACDADETAGMRIHSKLAPHKVAIHIKTSGDQGNTGSDDLNRFVLYLNNMLRAKGLNTMSTVSEEVATACLIPFVVSVDRTSLENGIVHVTNRSTTLDQAIHITDLAKHITTQC